MFGFFRRSGPRPVSAAISQAIKGQGLPLPLGDPARLRMVQWHGRFSDRQVTYFRVFDPVVMARCSLDIQRYRDLDAFQGLVLHAGHVDSDGSVTVIRPTGRWTAGGTSMRRAVRIFSPASARLAVASQARAADGPSTTETAAAIATS